MGRRHSDIWNYFKDNKDGSGICTVCKNKFSYKTSASNLRKHIRRKHPHIHLKGISKSVEIVDMENFDVIDLNDKQNKKLDKLLANSLHENNNDSCDQPEKQVEKLEEDSFVDDESDNDYNPFSDSCGSSLTSLINVRKIDRRKDHGDTSNDAKASDEASKPTRKSTITKQIKREIKSPPQKRSFIKTEGSRTYSSDSTEDLEKTAMKKTRSACDAYAANLSLQLDQMEDNQRFIAEKLISDIVFFGRFNKLSEEMQLALPNTSPERVLMLNEPNDSSKQVCLKCNGESSHISNDNEVINSVSGSKTPITNMLNVLCPDVINKNV